MGREGRFLAAWAALVVLVVAPCASTGPTPWPSEAEPLHLVVLHVNDVHGQVLSRRFEARGDEPARDVGGLPRLAAEIERQRRAAQAEGAEVLVVDAGDWFAGTPEGALDGGRAFSAAYAALGFDAMALGNHEFDHGVEPLVRLLRAVDPPAVCANLTQRATGRRPEWVAPWRIVERGGFKIALVGLLTPATPSITHPDAATLVFEEPAEALERARAEIGERADWILPLSHLGLGADRELARAEPWLDVVIGGHSHTWLAEGVREEGVLIVQVGTKARGLGRVDLWIDRASGRAVRSEARAIELDEEPPPELRDAEVDALAASLVERNERSMAQVLGTLEAPATRQRPARGSSAAGSLVADLFRARTGADVAVMNRGGVRSDLAAGPQTRRDVFDFLPFDNYLVTITMTGAELAELVRRGVEDETHSGLEVSGATLVVRRGEPRDTLVEVLLESGEAVAPDARYRVTMNSFMAEGGDGFLPDGLDAAEREVDPVLMRELLEDALRARGSLTPPVDDRYHEVAQ